MPMELKFDDQGVPVVVEKNGVKLPVYIDTDDPDGEGIEVDVPSLYTKITDVSAEAKKYRKEKAALKHKFKFFEDVEDVETWIAESKTARETVKNFDDKQLVDANKVDEIKKQIKEVHAEEIQNVKNSYKETLENYDKTIQAKDSTIYNLMVSSQFAQSKYFLGAGEKSVTLLPPEVAESYFGRYFKVEEDERGNLKAIGYDHNGKQILSKKNPGDLAEFDECMEVILNNYSKKDSIIRSTGAGSGAAGGAGVNTPTGVDAKIAKFKSLLEEARKNKDGKKYVTLKNQIFDLEQKKALGILK